MTTNILIISSILPSANHAGGNRVIDLYSYIKEKKYDLNIFLIVTSNAHEKKQSIHLSNTFGSIYYFKNHNFSISSLKINDLMKINFDIIDFQYTASGKFIRKCKSIWPESKFILSVMDSAIRSLIISLKKDPFCFIKKPIFTGKLVFYAIKELYYSQLVNIIVTVSKSDALVLNKFISNSAVLIHLPTCIDPENFSSKQLKVKENVIVFFAYFGSKTNEEALMWYCKKIHPLILKKINNYIFRVVGDGLSVDLIKELQSFQNIDIVGRVDSIFDAVNNSSIGIAPALSGAGVRGKIHQYSFYGIPCVASVTAHSELKYQHNRDILVADSAEDFLKHCLTLMENNSLYKKISINAKKICLTHYVWSRQDSLVKKIYGV